MFLFFILYLVNLQNWAWLYSSGPD